MGSIPVLTPEYLAADNSGPVWNLAIAMIVLETTFMSLFIAARFVNKSFISADTCFVTLGYIWSVGLCVLTFFYVKKGGTGRHVAAVILEDYHTLVTWAKIQLAAEFSWICAVAFPKLAILCVYLRIFTTRGYRNVTYLLGFVVFINMVAWLVAAAFICRPFRYNWDKSVPGGHCGNLPLTFKIVSIPNIATDLAILILPLHVTWNLHMKLSQKIGLTITWLVMSLGMVTAILRLYYFVTVDMFADPTYNGVTNLIWTVVEPGCYLIAAISPSLRPLWRWIKERHVFSSMHSSLTDLTRRPSKGVSEATLADLDRKPSRDTESSAHHNLDKQHRIMIVREFHVERGAE